MHKQLSVLMLLATMLVPWASHAQSAAATLPYSTGFESTDDNSNWEIINGSQNNKWFVGTAAHNGGSQGLYVSDNASGTTNNYSGSLSVVFAVRTVNFSAAGQYAIAFDWRCAGESTYDYLRCFLVPESTVLTAGSLPSGVTASGTPTGWIDLGGKMNVGGSVWHSEQHAFSVAAAGNMKLVFLWRNDGSVYNQTPAAVDNLQIQQLTCPTPTDLAVSNISAGGATFSWTAGGSESQWEYRVDDGAWTSTSTPSVTLTDLSASTRYAFSVRAVCGVGDTSFAASMNFNTSCGSISALPYEYGFDDATGNGSSYAINSCWTKGTSYSTAYPYPSSTQKRSAPYALYFYNTATTYSYVALPPMSMPLNTLQLTFWAYKTSASYGRYIVGVMTNPTDITTFDTVYIGQVENTSTWEEVEVPLNQYTGTGQFIAIKSEFSSANYIYIDDIKVDLMPTCPKVTELSATPGYDMVTVSWTENGTAAMWEVTLADATGVVDVDYATNSPSLTLDQLTPNTDYTVTVRALCGAGDTSGARSCAFHTACTPIVSDSLPLVYGFEDASGTGASATFNTCFGRHTNNSSAFPYISSTQKHSGTYSLYFYSTTTLWSYLTLPLFEDNLSSMMLSFWAYKTSANYGHYIVGVMSNPDDLSTFDTLLVGQVSDVSSWEYVELPLSAYDGDGTYLAILSPNSGASYLYLDDITVDYVPDCARPSDIVVTDTLPTSLGLSWTNEGFSTTEYLVEYGPAGFELGNGIQTTVATNYITLTDLQMGTSYDVYVYALCSGDTSTFTSATVTTACDLLTEDYLPYFENFEAYGTGSTYGISPCWTKGTSSTTAYPYPYSTAAINGDRGLYFYGYWPTSATTTKVYSWAAMPQLDESLDVSDLMVEFMMKRYSTVSNYYTSLLYVGIADSLTNFDSADSLESSVVWMDTIDLVDEPASSVHSIEVSFENYTGDGRYVVFYAPIPSLVGSATYRYNYVYIDDVNLRTIPTCFRPESLTTTAISHDSIALAWHPDSRTPSPSGWVLEYGPHGFVPGSESGIVENLTDTVYIVTGLSSDTEYDFYVSANCGSEVSDARMASERTFCVPVDSLPYVEDFERYASGSANPIDPCWNKQAFGTATAYPYPNTTAACNGSLGLYFYSTSAISSYAATPIFSSSLSDLMLSFDLKRYSNTTSTYHSIMQVGVMSNPRDTSTFELLREIDLTAEPASTVQHYLISLENYTGNGRCIAFRAPYLNVSSHYNYVSLDDVEIAMLPACRWPLSLTVDSMGAYEAQLSWTASASSFEVQLSQNEEFTGATTTSTVVSGTSCTLSNLLSYTNYYVRVRALCGNDSSLWSEVLPFRTHIDCGPNRINISDTIGDGTSSGYYYTFAAYSTYPTGYSRTIYTAEEMAELGVLANNTINSISLQTGTASGMIRQAKVYMVETDMSEFSSTPATDTAALPRSAMSLVYSGDIATTANSWIEIPLDTVFPYSGSRNLMVMLVHDTTPTATQNFYYTAQSGVYRSCYGYRTSATTVNNTCTRSVNRPNIIFNICTEVPTCTRPSEVTLVDLTDTSVSFTWENVGSQYEVLLSTSLVEPDSLASFAGMINQTTAANSITLTGLTASTGYYFYVRNICGAANQSLWTIPFSFTTPCAPQALPFTEDFESYGTGSTVALGACWNKGTNSTTAYPYPYSTNAVNGSRSLYFYAYRSSTSATYSYVALPVMQDSVKHLSLSMNVRRYSTTTDSYTTRLVVGVMTNPEDISTFEPMDTIDLKNEAALSVHGYEFYFNNYSGNGRHIAIYNEAPPLYGTATTCYSYAYVDDIMVDYIPTCPRVGNVTVSDITATSATVRWNSANYASGTTFVVECVERGASHGSGVTVTATADSAVITGLEGAMDYDVYVRANCSATDQSEWSFVKQFATLCAPRSLPMFFDPEDYAAGTNVALPTCWTRVNNASGSYTYYPYIYTSSTNTHTGTKTLYYYFSTSSGYPTDEMMVFPEIDTINFPMNTVEVSFWGKRSTNASSVIVGVVSDPTSTATFTVVDTVRLTTTSTEYIVSFANYTGNGSYVALRGVRSGSSATYIYLDDISIRQLSPCPRAYDLTVEEVTATTATLAWTDTIGSSQWVIEYSAVGAATPTILTVNSNPYTLTGLTANTLYTYRVAPVCYDGQQADWSLFNRTFTTSQVPAVAPYTYDFEDAAEWNNWVTVSNGNALWYRGVVDGNSTNNVMYQSTDGGTTHSWTPGSIVNSFAYRDIDFGPTPRSYDLSFYYRGGGCNEGNYDGVSVLIADPSVPVTDIASTGLYSPWGNITTVHARMDTVGDYYVVHFDNMSGVKRLVFDFFQSTTAQHTYNIMPPVVDDIQVAVPACERPFGLTADTASFYSVDIHWAGDTAGTYLVDYRPAGTTGTDLFDTVLHATSHTIVNMLPSTTYNIWVRKLCSDTLRSYWSTPVTVKTMCAPISVMDTLREDFESYTPVAYNSTEDGELPNCWESYTTGPTGKLPHVTDSGSYSYCISGRQAITMTSGLNTSWGNDTYVRLADIAEPTNTLTLAFWMCTESSTNGYLQVGYLTGDNYETDFVAVDSIHASSLTVHSGNGIQSAHGIYDTVSFANVPAGNYPLAFRWNYTSSFYSVCIDDVAVWTTFSCYPPSVEVTDTAYNSATIVAQSNSNSAQGYTLAYGTQMGALADTLYSQSGTFDLTDLEFNTTYYYAVRQQCEADAYSSWTGGSFVTPDMPCFVPDTLVVSNPTYTGAQVTWTPGNEETLWEVRAYSASPLHTALVQVSGTPAVTFDTLLSGVTYEVSVRALCVDDFYSDWSDTVALTTLGCEAPTGVAAGNVTATGATVSWQGSAAAYVINYGTQGINQGEGHVDTVQGTSYTISGLAPQTPYDVYVRSICADGVNSDWSPVTRFTTAQVGIDDVNANANISLYPNPASHAVTISGIEGTATVTVIDLNGRQVYSTQASGSLTIDVSTMAKGAYFVRIAGERSVVIRKLVVK